MLLYWNENDEIIWEFVQNCVTFCRVSQWKLRRGFKIEELKKNHVWFEEFYQKNIIQSGNTLDLILKLLWVGKLNFSIIKNRVYFISFYKSIKLANFINSIFFKHIFRSKSAITKIQNPIMYFIISHATINFINISSMHV